MNDLPISPSREEFVRLAKDANLIAISTELMPTIPAWIASPMRLAWRAFSVKA